MTEKLLAVAFPVTVNVVTVNGTNIVALDVTVRFAVVTLEFAVTFDATRLPEIEISVRFAKLVGRST